MFILVVIMSNCNLKLFENKKKEDVDMFKDDNFGFENEKLRIE